MSPRFLTEPTPPRGTLLPVLPGVSRLVADNPGRMTYHGTNTYLLQGADGVTVIDPGPNDPAHVANILRLSPGPIRRILLTHTHADHLGAAAALRAATSAPTAAWHSSADPAFTPDQPLADGDEVAGMVALFTPGHAADHLCFARPDGTLFSGDLVMAWSTTVVSPPGGDMAAYFASLYHLLARTQDALYLPGHGPALPEPLSYVSDLLAHRLAREEAILAALATGPTAPAKLVEALYPELDPALRPAAERNVIAHLLRLQHEGKARTVNGTGNEARWQIAEVSSADRAPANQVCYSGSPMQKPDRRPANLCFSSGPCAKRPGWSLAALDTTLLGRSHRAPAARAQLREVVRRSAALLGMPDSWQLGVVPASDTGAVEMAMWSLLGPRPVDVLAFESFSAQWAADISHQLQLADIRTLAAPYGHLPDLTRIDPAHDLVLAWNGTTSGVRLSDGPWLQRGDGLVICDATSAAFAMELPWDRLDVVTWSWQKALGGEAAHGMLALSPPRPGSAGATHAALADAQDLPHHAGSVPRRDHQHAVHAVRGRRAGWSALGRAHRRPARLDRPRRGQLGGHRRVASQLRLGAFLGRGAGRPLPHLHLPAHSRARRRRADHGAVGGRGGCP